MEQFRGRHTELVSVYVPAGYNINESSSQISDEQSTASNIKSKSTKKNVMTALEKIVRHLKLFKKTPPNGLVVFCGNISKKEGEADIKIWSMEPPLPMNQKIYWCGQTFVLDPLRDLTREKEVYGLIVMDTSEGDIGLLIGKKIQIQRHIDSLVPGKTTKGGWCVRSNSLVHLPDGSIIKIKNLKQDDDSILSYDFIKNKVTVGNFDAIQSRKTDYFYEIKTVAPSMMIQVTPEHRFFVLENGYVKTKSAEDLTLNDRLLSPKKIDIEGKPRTLHAKIPYKYKISKHGREYLSKRRRQLGIRQRDIGTKLGISQAAISKFELGERNLKIKNVEEIFYLLRIDKESFFKRFVVKTALLKFPKTTNERLCRLIGYMLGDGGLDGNRIRLYEGDLSLLRLYQSIVKSTFQVNSKVKHRKNKNYYELKIYSKYLIQIITEFFDGIFGVAAQRRIPRMIPSLPKRQIASFIKGLFDAEGYVDSSIGALGITMSSESIIKTLQLLLLRFGIISSFSARKPDGSFAHKMKYAIRITDFKSLSKFHKQIGFTSQKKTYQLEKIIITKKTSLVKHKIFKNLIAIRIKEKIKLKANSNDSFFDISVPKYNNFITNGIILHNSQQRYARIREEAKHDYMKKLGEAASDIFKKEKDLKGVIVGGPGPLKDKFNGDDFLDYQIKDKVLGIVDTSYTGIPGLQELVERGEDLIKEASAVKERHLMEKFFGHLEKDDGLAVYGIDEVKQALEYGAVDILLISEDFDWLRVKLKCSCGHLMEQDTKPDKKHFNCPKCGNEMTIEDEVELVDILSDKAKSSGTEVEIVSTETREGVQFKELGGVGGILRFRI